MSDIHNLHDYAFSKKMLEEIPAAVEDIHKCLNILYKHRAFNAVCDSIIALNNASLELETRLPYFQNIVNNKGEV